MLKGTLLGRRVMDFSTVPDKTVVDGCWVDIYLVVIVCSYDSNKKCWSTDYQDWMKMENDIVDKYDHTDYDTFNDYIKILRKN